ncbi:MAG: pseudouridine-5'-phosphate glycosidase [Anaerolineae bacterium]|nr:pseudouridine-5'-phosphate glycosidase [Anaerolineae bacterium]
MPNPNLPLTVAPQVAEALARRQPVVALESALITHGLPRPVNQQVARQMEAIVRAEGATPATVALLAGEVKVGLSPQELERLAHEPEPAKISQRDLPVAVAQGRSGGTTVAATMTLAYRAGIRVFATGGIGGVHRSHPEDVSADLPALATTPMLVVCAGAKAILDLPRTLEALETLGVPVVGYQTDTFPAFTSRSSGLPLAARADSPQDVAAIARARNRLGLPASLLVCVPIPSDDEMVWAETHAAVEATVAEADERGISGRDLTPFLLARLADRTGGESLAANKALLFHNSRVAAHIARALDS